MEIDVRVGFAATSVLEKMLEDSIRAMTVNQKYVGPVEWLVKYATLRAYNNDKGGDQK